MDNSQCRRLISLYRRHRCLWDPTDSNYTNRAVRDEVWYEISRKMDDIPVDELKSKMRSLSGGYRREKFREKQSRITGTDYKSKWFAYDDFSFLADKNDPGAARDHSVGDDVKKRKKKEVVEEPEVEQSAEEYEEDSYETPDHIVIKEEPDLEKTPPKFKYVCSKPRLTRVVKRRLVKDNTLAERNKLLERKLYKRPEIYKKKDECDTFGEYIAVSLRKHDERTRSMIKQAINNILFEQEMKKYNSGQYAVVVTNMDENPLIIGDECEK